ncbi:MAG: hypothetical protein IRY91_03010 [Gemmatimonadaceae bacterium]|nr:hypothetical protein [Gemmatimonadaceae bacterium]
MRTPRCLLILAVAVLGVNACAHHAHESEAVEPYEAPTLRIENHHWLDMDIFVIHEGQRTRLGAVTAASTKVFVFPRGLVGGGRELRLVADPVGAPGAVTTDTFVLHSGTQVTWTLESNLQRSSFTVY